MILNCISMCSVWEKFTAKDNSLSLERVNCTRILNDKVDSTWIFLNWNLEWEANRIKYLKAFKTHSWFMN